MATVLLFHHVQGLTPGVTAFADAVRAAGHTVHVPDLFEGRTFNSIENGMAFVRGNGGFGAVAARGRAAADALPDDLVYAGFSLGVVPAQDLAQNRSGARGALLFNACMPAAEFGTWPEGLRAQVHGMDADPSSPRRTATSPPPKRSPRSRKPSRSSSTPATSTCSPTARCPHSTRSRPPC